MKGGYVLKLVGQGYLILKKGSSADQGIEGQDAEGSAGK